jgi:hypothetical protein
MDSKNYIYNECQTNLKKISTDLLCNQSGITSCITFFKIKLNTIEHEKKLLKLSKTASMVV